MRVRATALALASAIFLAAWASPPPNSAVDFSEFDIRPENGKIILPQSIKGESVEHTVFAGADGPDMADTRIARSEEAWAALWAMAGREAEMRLGAGQMGAGIFLGMRPTGGYAVEILAVVENDGRLEIFAKESAPGPDEIVTQALTYPWAIVLAHDAPAGEPVIRVLGPKNDE